MEIQKAKITKDNTLCVVYKNDDGDVITHEGANIIHVDCRDAFNALIPHFAVLTEQREAYGKKLVELKDNDDVALKLSVSGITISGSSSNESVMITGCRMLESNKVLNMNTPLTALEGEGDVYEYADDLYQLIENIKFEIKAYIEEKKWALKQTSFDFGEGDNPFSGDIDEEAGKIEVPSVNVDEIKGEESGKKGKKRVKHAA